MSRESDLLSNQGPHGAGAGRRSVRGVGVAEEGERTACLCCGFQVTPRPWGCKNPCRNCGFVYPLGDCSD